jgi:hypothetical protein
MPAATSPRLLLLIGSQVFGTAWLPLRLDSVSPYLFTSAAAIRCRQPFD